MKSKEYWNKRFELLENSEHVKATEYLAKLDEQYRKASKKVQNEVSLWYARFANNNEISMQEARKMLTAGELEEFKWSVEEYIKKGHIPEQWEKQLENASARVHVTRLDALKMQMQEHVETLFHTEDQGLTDALKRIYTDGYYHTAFEIQKGIGIGFDLMKLDMDAVEKVVRKPWASDGANFSSRIWKSKAQLVNKLHTDLSQAIIMGKNPSTLIDGISKSFDVSRAQAGRLVNTEASFIYSASERDSFKELGVEEYEILATLDNKTSEICQGMDGQHFPISQYEIGTTAPPFHPNCRTTTVPYFDDEFTLDETRAYRDADTDYGTVPASMKYPEWEEKYLKETYDTVDAEQPAEANTITHQYKYTEPLNEFEYFSKEQEGFRLESIKELTGYDDSKSTDVLHALCGDSNDYNGIGNSVPKGWFCGNDVDIRTSTDGEFFEKAKIIDEYIKDAPQYRGTIYRGLALDDETIEAIKNNGIIEENGLLSSWTNDNSVADMFASARSEQYGTNKVIFECTDDLESTPVAHLSIYGNEENEVLVSNFTNKRFIVDSYREENDAIYFTLKKGG